MKAGFLGVFVAGMALLGCGLVSDEIKGSGVMVTQQIPISDFTRVEAGNSFKITVRQADGFSIVVKSDDNLVEHLNVHKSGDTLMVRLKSGISARSATLEAEVSLPELTGIRLSGASAGIIQGTVGAESFAANLSGASRLSGDIQAVRTDVRLSGASSVDLMGSSSSVKLKGSGASRAVLGDFSIGSAEVNLSGASMASLNVKDNIGPASLSGASRLTYLGDPAIRNFQTSGASSIRPVQ